MKSILLLILFSILLISSAAADETEGKTELGLKGAINSYWGDINDRQVNGSTALALFWWLTDPFAIGVNGGVDFLQAENGDAYFKTMVYRFSPMIKVKLFPSSSLNPYLLTGFDVMHINPQARDGGKLPNNAAKNYENLQFAVPFGGGLVVNFSERVGLELEGMYHQALTDYLDDIKVGDRLDGWFTLTLGLNFYLGRPLDSDGDGIRDKQDADPLHPEDFDDFEDFDGAPDPDNDQDGVLDVDDKAPNIPEDRDGFQDSDGVPDPDNDGDGIPDKDDKAPGTDATVAAGINTAEDFDGFQDDDGIPDPDNDQDGILDKDDKCPDEPETVNGYQDEDGCPDTKPEVDVGQSIVLEGVNFASGSAELETNSRRILDKVVENMAKYPDIEVEIRGYTDNTGSYQGNLNISKRRADSVRDYLVSQGIASYRIVTKGLGPENPIASNNTREGRAQNRRIEFYRIK